MRGASFVLCKRSPNSESASVANGLDVVAGGRALLHDVVRERAVVDGECEFEDMTVGSVVMHCCIETVVVMACDHLGEERED